MGEPAQKIPEGAVVWEAPGGPPEIIMTYEPDGMYVLWEWRPDMIKYGYTTGYAAVDQRDTKREAVQRAKELIKMNRKQKVNRLAGLLRYDHAKKAPDQLQLERPKRHHSTRKSAAQLDGEIQAILTYPKGGDPKDVEHWVDNWIRENRGKNWALPRYAKEYVEAIRSKFHRR